MRTLVGLVTSVLVALLASSTRADILPPPDHRTVAPVTATAHGASPLSYTDATVLGLVEGITEFLPVSSTGHLILATHLLGLDSETPATDAAGTTLWIAPPDASTNTPGRLFTIKAAADTYSVAIQVGAIAAVALLYWRRILTVFAGLLGRDPAGLRLLRNLLIAFFPAVVLGLAFDDMIEEALFNPVTVAAALVVGAIVMFVAERRQPATSTTTPDLDPADLSPKQALLIGVMQCGALWPGMSRSMMTIVGGYVAGLRPARAAEFSFLLGLPTLAGAAVLKTYKTGALTLAAFGPGPLAWGAVVAAISAGLAVAWLVSFLTRHGLALFAWYRIALAIGVLVFLGA